MPVSRIYPTWEQLSTLKSPLTDGEKVLVKYLDNYLPKDQNWTKEQKLSDYNGWLIFVQSFLNGSRPDVVAFNPFVGVIIYEVKDWNPKNYSWSEFIDEKGKKHKILKVSDSRGDYEIKRPDLQVKHYKEKIIGQLVPIIGEEIDKNSLNYGLIKTGLYFHKCTTDIAIEKFGFPIPDKDLKYFPIIGYDGLREENLLNIVPEVKYSTSKFWKREWNEDIIFWLYPPYHSLDQGIPLRLKGKQLEIAEAKSGHYRVRGVAGSGKTQALAYRAGLLASEGKNVLIITFNITLWHYIKDMIQRSPFAFRWDKITFSHFHGFCKDKLNEFDLRWPKSGSDSETELEQFFKTVVPNAVIRAIQSKEYQKYDAILIDEGQDYHFEWYHMLSSYFLTPRDEMVVVCDKKQNIYDRELDWLDKRVTRQGLEKFTEPYIDLTTSYRMPAKVAVMSNEFSELFEMNQELKVGKIEGAPVLFHSQHIVWLNIEDKQWLDYIHKSFLRFKKEGYNPTDMVILLPNHKYGQECVSFFKNMNIEVNHVFESETEGTYHPHKKAFYMGDSRLKMSTIHSFKGWELPNIILYIPPSSPESNKRLDSIVYTAITRTRENLIVLNANKRYSEFGEKFPKSWVEQ